MDTRLSVLVSGIFARVPEQGGLVWVVLQYLLGLRRLGHRVTLVEPVAESDLVPVGASFSKSRNEWSSALSPRRAKPAASGVAG